MRRLSVFMLGKEAGYLEENDGHYSFRYYESYEGQAISRTLPVCGKEFHFTSFPPFFDGLLPEGGQLEYLLKMHKIDSDNYMAQLAVVGDDLVGAVTVHEEIGE